jgi:hypothetical protein
MLGEKKAENSHVFSLNLKFSLLDFSKVNDIRIVMYIKIEREIKILKVK